MIEESLKRGQQKRAIHVTKAKHHVLPHKQSLDLNTYGERRFDVSQNAVQEGKRARGSNKRAKQREARYCKCKNYQSEDHYFAYQLYTDIYTSYLTSIFANSKNRSKD